MLHEDFIDNYEHIDSNIEYLIENELYPPDGTETHAFLQEQLNFQITNCCACKFQEDCLNCIHGSNYKQIIVNETQQIILNKNRINKDIIYECFNNCRCPNNCLNRLVQLGPRSNLNIIKFSKGFEQYGLTSTEDIIEGSFVTEYAGEILSKEEAIRRTTDNEKFDKMNYIICLNEISELGEVKIQTFIDPSRKGNIGRYINHSCEPNCDIISVRLDSIVPKLAIFANRNIKSYEEITFSYGDSQDDASISDASLNRKLCYCKSKSCQKFLPNKFF